MYTQVKAELAKAQRELRTATGTRKDALVAEIQELKDILRQMA